MAWRFLLAAIVLTTVTSLAISQTRVAIPRSALTSPDQVQPPGTSAASRSESGFGGFSQWRTQPIAQTADSRNSPAPLTDTPAGATTPAAIPVNTNPPVAGSPAAAAATTTPASATAVAKPFPTAVTATGTAPAAATPAGAALQPIEPLKDIRNPPRKPVANVSQTTAVLPNEAGQVWREYDITPYTTRVSSTHRPEQAIVDWILRETGYEAWHSEPLGILSANAKSVRVYHTPEMQAVVGEVIDRFVSSEAESQAFGINVVTLANPNWRVNAQRFLQPIAVQTQGIQAWLLRREDAALVLAELRRRGDFREHSAPQMLINSGQSAAVNVTQRKQYVRNVLLRQTTAGPAPESDLALFDEGFALELNPLLSLDGRTVDAVLKCQIDQLEKLVPVMLDAPSPLQPRQRLKIDVPQATHFRLQERFRWPADQVLVVGLGLVALPTPQEPNTLMANLPLLATPARADMLLFVENRGKGSVAVAAPATASIVAPTASVNINGGRY